MRFRLTAGCGVMTLDDIPGQLEQLAGRARAVLDLEIGQAKKIAAAASAEKNSAQTALSELQDQHKQVQSQLDAVNKELGQALTLAGLNREIAAAGKKLKALQAETAEAETALAALQKRSARSRKRKTTFTKLVAF